ncbi:MAG: acyl-CoA dehydrogenase family protein [Nitrospirae bacterium]|nr:acyl-CoA dehydrogenase family protein [Nitrospirota bacterium]
MESTSERKLLQESLARLLKERCGIEKVRGFIKSGEPDGGLWKELGEMGFLGLLAPSELGGMAGSPADLLAVQSEMGRRLVPLPYLQHVAAIYLLSQTGAKASSDILRKAISGEVRLSLPLGADSLRWCAKGTGKSPEKHLLPFGPAVDHVVGAAAERGKVEVRLIPSAGKGIVLKRVDSIDLTHPLYTFKSSSKTSTDLRFQVPKDRWAKVLAETDLLTTAAVCAEILGGAEEALRLTIEYTKARTQFDRPIGTFQAVQHKAANAGVLLEGIRSYVAQASVLVSSNSPGRKRAVQMAKAYASDAYLRIAETGLQLHGGIGYTWEHDIHLYLRHAKRCGQSHGDPSSLRELHVQAIR